MSKDSGIDFQAEAGAFGKKHMPLLYLRGLFENAGLQVRIIILHHFGAGGRGDQVRRSQQTRTKIRGVGSHFHIVGFSQDGDFAPLTDPAHLGHARLDVGNCLRVEHGLELIGRAGVLTGGEGHFALIA